VREFVRRVAKSELYRSRFFDSCYRYRAIELNFKHLLGRAPNDFDEMRHHSTILDADGFEAEIDSYIDSDEYCHHFGDDIVPYYRGYKTQTGQSMLEFTNMLQLMRSASSSDKDVKSGNRARLTRSLILNRPYGIVRSTDSKVLLAQLFGSNVPHEMASEPSTDAALYRQEQEQNALIASLQQQLADLRPFGAIGSAVIRQGKFASAAVVDPQATLTSGSSALQQTIADQQALIASLQAEIAEARSLAAIGEARLNKWRQRTFF
jgi:phycoerythrin-associated linker protein